MALADAGVQRRARHSSATASWRCPREHVNWNLRVQTPERDVPGRDESADANKAPAHSETTMRGATDAGGIVVIDFGFGNGGPRRKRTLEFGLQAAQP